MTMRVLLVEDHSQYRQLVCEKLIDMFGYQVDSSSTPDDANDKIRAQVYDIVVVDILYRALSELYNNKRTAARSSLAELAPYNQSGLTVLQQLEHMSDRPAHVIWTSGDPNRALHLVFAYQQYRTRVFCSKESSIEEMGKAIRAASSGTSFVDLSLQPFMPRPGLPQVGEILFRERRWRAIWRALAAGASAHHATAQMTNYSEQTIRKCMSPMAHQLAILNPRINADKQPFNQLSSYASFHWEFFLDQAVYARYPH